MRILDANGAELMQFDHSKGYLVPEKRLIAHHEAVEAVAEQGHYEVIAEYENGGKDVKWVVDVAGVKATPAWDEYEDILRYIIYTEEELAERSVPSAEERIAALEEALRMLLEGVTE